MCPDRSQYGSWVRAWEAPGIKGVSERQLQLASLEACVFANISLHEWTYANQRQSHSSQVIVKQQV